MGKTKAFIHILNNASGVIREKIDLLFENSIPAAERSELAALIYYPEDKLAMIKKQDRDMGEWYRITLHRLIDVCRLVASKYTRSKVRKALPKYFEYIIDELLHTNYDLQNKEQYYGRIISTIIDLDRADAFIVAMASLIKRLAVDCLHIIGDIFDRGPRADYIMDSLMRHHCVDIQWGNHDILWMGAAARQPGRIANVLHVSLQYNNLDIIEDGYGISLRELIVFAQSTYNDCSLFAPRLLDEDVTYNPNDIRMVSKLHKAIMVMLFKLEGQVILRHPEYQMQDRLLLNHIDYQRHTVEIDGVQYPLRDCDFPTIDPNNPYHLTAEEEDVMQRLKDSFVRSARLQEHVRF